MKTTIKFLVLACILLVLTIEVTAQEVNRNTIKNIVTNQIEYNEDKTVLKKYQFDYLGYNFVKLYNKDLYCIEVKNLETGHVKKLYAHRIDYFKEGTLYFIDFQLYNNKTLSFQFNKGVFELVTLGDESKPLIEKLYRQ